MLSLSVDINTLHLSHAKLKVAMPLTRCARNAMVVSHIPSHAKPCQTMPCHAMPSWLATKNSGSVPFKQRRGAGRRTKHRDPTHMQDTKGTPASAPPLTLSAWEKGIGNRQLKGVEVGQPTQPYWPGHRGSGPRHILTQTHWRRLARPWATRNRALVPTSQSSHRYIDRGNGDRGGARCV